MSRPPDERGGGRGPLAAALAVPRHVPGEAARQGTLHHPSVLVLGCAPHPRNAVIRRIPELMDMMRWPVAASLMRAWQQGGPFEKGRTERGVPVRLVDWTWYEGFARGQRAIRHIASALAPADTSWPPKGLASATQEAESDYRELCRQVRRSREVKLVHLDPPNEAPLGLKLDIRKPLYVGVSTVGALNDPADDMLGALAQHGLRVYFTGRAVRKSDTELELTADGVWMRVADSYDFKGKQYLGSWSDAGFEERLSAINFVLYRLTGLTVGESPSRAQLTNADFEAYRARGCGGTDFKVVSELRAVPGVTLPLVRTLPLLS